MVFNLKIFYNIAVFHLINQFVKAISYSIGKKEVIGLSIYLSLSLSIYIYIYIYTLEYFFKVNFHFDAEYEKQGRL